MGKFDVPYSGSCCHTASLYLPDLISTDFHHRDTLLDVGRCSVPSEASPGSLGTRPMKRYALIMLLMLHMVFTPRKGPLVSLVKDYQHVTLNHMHIFHVVDLKQQTDSLRLSVQADRAVEAVTRRVGLGGNKGVLKTNEVE